MNGAMLEVLGRTKAREALRHYASSCSCSSPVVVEELGRLLDKADAAGLSIEEVQAALAQGQRER